MYDVDIETVDPNLRTKGDGSIRKDGRILCVGVHGEGSLGEVSEVFRPEDPKLKDILASEDTKVFHNGIYDMAWLVNGHGMAVNGFVDDTMTREALLDEYADGLSLDACCMRHGVEGKNYKDTVEQWWADSGHKGKAIQNLDKIPYDVVARYCHQDVKAGYQLWHKQQPLIAENRLEDVVQLEGDLMPLVMRLRRNGIRIDTRGRDALKEKWSKQLAEAEETLHGMGLKNLNSPKQITEFMNARGVVSGTLTETGAQSWNAEALDALEEIDPSVTYLKRGRMLGKAVSTFLNGYLTDLLIGDRVHSVLKPMKRDIGGTITSRWSADSPNLQNIPSNARTGGPEIRALFLPEDGCTLLAADYKQIEYVVFIHYAIGAGAEEAREAIRQGVDYHALAQKILGWDDPKVLAEMGLDAHDARGLVKRSNFASLYGTGKTAFASMNRKMFEPLAKAKGVSVQRYSDMTLDTYYKKMSFVRPTCLGMQNLVRSKGFMRSIGGRIHHKPMRKGDYAIVNYICQGGAADILKAGLVKAWQAGVFECLTPHMLVHDEVVCSVPHSRAGVEAARELQEIMCNAVKLKVPIRMDMESGPNWASGTSDNWTQWVGECEG
jgi:DNA polymerase-1